MYALACAPGFDGIESDARPCREHAAITYSKGWDCNPRMADKPSSCLFCGQTLQSKTASRQASATREHIVPQWLQAYLGVTKEDTLKPLLVETATRRPIDVREHGFGAFVAGGVCAACNGGWMNDLENAVKPILTGLLEGRLSFSSLNQEQLFALARWTLKTAAALNRSSSYAEAGKETTRSIPDEHLRTLADGGIPQDVIVVGAHAMSYTKLFDFLQFATWTRPTNSIPLEEDHLRRSYKIGLSFRGLIFIAAHYPSSDYAYCLNTQKCFEIFAGRRVVPFDHIWDNTVALSLSPLLEVPMRNVSVASRTWLELVDNTALVRFVL